MSDIKLVYKEYGNGEPLILIHGNGDSGAYFVNQIDAFAAHYRVFVPDTRGHGATPRGEKPFSLYTFADDLYDFCIEHGLNNVNVLGFSDGGNIALLFALKYPDIIGRLIIDSANIFPEGLNADFLEHIRNAYEEKKNSDNADERRDASFLRLMTEEPVLTPEDLKRLSCKTLVIGATQDLITAEHTTLIGQSIPGAKLVFLEGTHCVAKESPDTFNKVVIDWLKG